MGSSFQPSSASARCRSVAWRLSFATTRTLVELLVVIAIIGVLVALIVVAATTILLLTRGQAIRNMPVAEPR